MTDNQIQNKNTLPPQPEHAIQHLCKLSQSLIDIAERESQALIQKDLLAFAVLQDEKERVSVNYMEASQSFRARLNEFRRVDQSIIGRLEKLQSDLGERTNDNNKLLQQMTSKAEATIKDSMEVAQEYADSERSHFEKMVAYSTDSSDSIGGNA